MKALTLLVAVAAVLFSGPAGRLLLEPGVQAAAEPGASMSQSGGRFNWPSFRGPNASGIADGQAPPVRWNAATQQNVAWRTPIPGVGHSSPVVWNDRVFVTSAVSSDLNSVFTSYPSDPTSRWAPCPPKFP